jgi:hypothetical protein
MIIVYKDYRTMEDIAAGREIGAGYKAVFVS